MSCDMKPDTYLFEPSTAYVISQYLPLDVLQYTFDLARTNAARHLYTDAIGLFDYAISQTEHTILSLLLAHRAAACLNIKKYDNALADANRAMELSPELPDGYVQAATVFLLQDNLGKALTTYTDLTERVPENHPLYGAFVARKKILEEEVEKRNNNVFQRFPYDILHRILSYLSLKDYVNCASTCKTWHRFFDGWSPMFRELDMQSASFPHIQRLNPEKIKYALRELILPISIPDAVDAMAFLASSECRRIQSISIDEQGNSAVLEGVPALSFRMNQLFSLNRLHLRRVHLLRTHREVFCLAATALNICPNLEELVVHVYSWDNFQESYQRPSWPKHKLRLTRLFFGGMQMSAELLGKLLKRCPDLKHLVLHPSDHEDCEDILNLVYDHCPNLLTLCYNYNQGYPCREWNDHGNEKHGLWKMNIGAGVYEVNSSLERFFRRYHDTLEYLELNLGAARATHRCLETLASLVAPRLQTLYLTDPHRNLNAQSKSLPEAVEALIRATPRLQTLGLRQLDLEEWDNVFEALGDVKTLEHISFDACKVPLNEGLLAMFLGAQSLRSFEFSDKSVYARNSLAATLQSVMAKPPQYMKIVSDALNDDIVVNAFSRCGYDPAVQQLHIQSRGNVTWRTLDRLATLPRLKTLILEKFSKIDRGDVFAYLKERSSDTAEVHILRPQAKDLPSGSYIRDKFGELSFIPKSMR